jgi:hypothetical protein
LSCVYIVCCLIVVSVLFVCCLIVVPLPPGENPFAVNNNNIPEDKTLQYIPIWSSLGFSWVTLEFKTYLHRPRRSVKCPNKQISQLDHHKIRIINLQPNVGVQPTMLFYSNRIKLNWWKYGPRTVKVLPYNLRRRTCKTVFKRHFESNRLPQRHLTAELPKTILT